MRTNAQPALLMISLSFSFLFMAPTCGKDARENAMLLTSSSFKNGSSIPRIHTCEGEDRSPELTWQNLPAKTQSLALIVDDPDAVRGNFVHWVVWNLNPTTKGLKGGIDAQASETLLVQGQNGMGNQNYKGPCPPSGTHRYFFKLYALDTKLTLPKTTTKEGLLAAIEGHILGHAELMGTYEKAK